MRVCLLVLLCCAAIPLGNPYHGTSASSSSEQKQTSIVDELVGSWRCSILENEDRVVFVP